MPRTINLLPSTVALMLLTVAVPLNVPAQTEPGKSQAAQVSKQTPEDKFERGKRLLAQGDMEAAIPLLRDTAQSRKKDSDAWRYYGLALSHAGRAKDARKAFEKALKLRPDDAGARAGLAYSLLHLGKPLDAEREARRAIALDAQLADAHYIIGVIRYREDKFTEAAEEAETALRLQPDLPAAAAILIGDTLLNIYVDESARFDKQHPLIRVVGEAERKAALDKRAAELEPLKARMREAAARIEALVKAHPNDANADAWSDLADSLQFYGSKPGEGGDEAAGIFLQKEVTTKAIITFKPNPGFSEEARQHNTTGVVRLRAVLAPDGRVRSILVLKRLPDGLSEKAVAAARKIKFTPATINGHPVAQYVVLEYNFSIY